MSAVVQLWVPWAGRPPAWKRSAPRGMWGTRGDREMDAHKRTIAGAAIQKFRGRKLEGVIELTVWVFMPVPSSWSKKKIAAALEGTVRPTSKPDWDNYGKLVSDALNNVVWVDDAQVTDAHVFKRYGTQPGFTIIVRSL